MTLDKQAKLGALFALGGCTYVGLEKLWRGRSHGSMFLAGGTGFLLLGAIGRKLPRLPRAARAVLGGGAITAVELATGWIFNRRWQIWDYRGIPGNYLGQICPSYSLLWTCLSPAGEALYRSADKLLTRPTPAREAWKASPTGIRRARGSSWPGRCR